MLLRRVSCEIDGFHIWLASCWCSRARINVNLCILCRSPIHPDTARMLAGLIYARMLEVWCQGVIWCFFLILECLNLKFIRFCHCFWKMARSWAAEEKMLLDSGLLFREPDSPAVLSTGGGRHWPEGRGVFVLEPKDDSSAMTAWINEEEHFKIMVASWMN